MMTPEQKFARWVRVSIAAFLGIFAWFIVADIWIPLTPDSTVMRVVTPVSSRVSGYVSHVYVHNNSQVKKGDLLYELDPTPFINKVEAAQIALEQAKLSNQQLDAQIAAARANLRTAQYTARNDKVTLDRYQRLSTMQNVSQSDLDKVRTTWQTSEQSVSALNAQIQNLLIQRGERDDKRNVTLQKYRNALEEARREPGPGPCGKRRYGQQPAAEPGIYTPPRRRPCWRWSTTTLTSSPTSRACAYTAVNTDAAVVFDALPGQVFPAHVTSSDAGILAGQEAVNGQLSQPEQSTRWVRDAQRMRIHVALDQPLDKPLPTGARATVQLYNSEGPFARTFAGLQIHLVSWLHYVY